MRRLDRGKALRRIVRPVARLAAGLLGLAVYGCLSAGAQTPSAAVLAAQCAACHGPGGVSPGAIPSINRLDAQTMAARLHGFRSAGGEVTVMNRIAKGYTDAEIDALAQYFAAQQR